MKAITVEPHKPGSAQLEDVAEPDVRDGTVLVEAIATVRRIMRSAATGAERLVLGTSSVEMSFAVSRDGTISLGVEGELRGQITHTITVELGPA